VADLDVLDCYWASVLIGCQERCSVCKNLKPLVQKNSAAKQMEEAKKTGGLDDPSSPGKW